MTDCSLPKKYGQLCEGYQTSGDDDEPCETCKNCIKCVDGYFQLGEVDTDLMPEYYKEVKK